MLQQAFWLAKKEMKYGWIALGFTVMATALLALFTTIVLDQSVRKLFGTETMYYNELLLDILFVVITPSLAAIFMSGPYLSFRTIKEDPFTKRMAFFRSLPIPVKVLALSRTIMMLATLLIMSSIFYIVLAIGLPDRFYQYITLNEFLIFILFWFGYALALGGLNPFIEYGTNGKILHLTPFVLIGIFIIVMIIFSHFFDHSIVEWSILLVKDYGWILAIISLLVGMIGCFFWYRMLTNRLLNRDYL